MSEQPELTDPFAEKLSRFTPDPSGFDRDALLFQAGQASVRPRRLWPAFAGLLAMSQAATLLFFLVRSPEPAAPIVVVAPRAESPIVEETTPRLLSQEPREWSYRRPAMTGNVDDLPKTEPVEYVAIPDKVLTVHSFSSVLSVN